MTSEQKSRAFLITLTGAALLGCYFLVAPFLKAVLFAAILAIVFYPVHSWVHRRVRNRDVAAAVSTLLVVGLLAILSALLAHAITSGLASVYRSLRSPGGNGESLSVYLLRMLDALVAFLARYVPVSPSQLQSAISSQAEKWIGGILASGTAMLGSAASLAGNAAISFFVLFFFLRDGRSILRRGAVVVPLEKSRVIRLNHCIQDTLVAALYGTLGIAIVQGLLTSVAFWFLGIGAPILWGLVTALCALLPVIGTAFVFLPAIAMLAHAGLWGRALILTVWALVIVHPIDNVLRPLIIGGRMKLSVLWVFFSLVGGVRAFGALGMFLGPLILALTVALFVFIGEERAALRKASVATPQPADYSALHSA